MQAFVFTATLLRFPDMAQMVEYGKSKGVVMGFYSDNCRCHEKGATHYPQDAHLAEALGFDSLKIDSCGNQRDMAEWASLFAKEARPLLVENCGNGPAGANPKHDADPLPAWLDMLGDTCPFSFYRVSVDVAPQFHSCVYNQNRALPYLHPTKPLSRPGCFAYADMLEVGVKLTDLESRTHFAMWSIISSPMILGFDLSDDKTVDAMWSIIANEEVS